MSRKSWRSEGSGLINLALSGIDKAGEILYNNKHMVIFEYSFIRSLWRLQLHYSGEK